MRSVSSLETMARDNRVAVEQLVRQFKKGPRAVDGIDLYVAVFARRDHEHLRLPLGSGIAMGSGRVQAGRR